MNLLTQEHFARAAEYAIHTVDVPCALGSAYLQFSVNSAFSHGVCRTQFVMIHSCLDFVRLIGGLLAQDMKAQQQRVQQLVAFKDSAAEIRTTA